jgi:multisubunit Na+/H+ antiporter MnhC subunit
MKRSSFWGILLIAIGILLLLKTLNILSFSWKDLIKLWPLILVWVGIWLIPMKDIFKIILDIIVFALGIYILVAGNPLW